VNVQFEKIDDLNAIATVSILKADYQEKLDQQLKDYRKKANIPGFRRGNAPLGMLKNMVGKSIMYDIVTKDAIVKLYDYFDKEKINILAQPIESDTKMSDLNFDEFGDFIFNFDVAIAPEFEIAISDQDVLKFAKVEVSEEVVKDEIKMIQRQYGTLSDKDAVASENDSIEFSLTELNEDKTEKENGSKNVNVKVLIEVIKDENLRNELLKLKKDAEGTFDNIRLLFNDNTDVMKHYFGIAAEDVEGLSNVFSYKVLNISALEPAELNQELFDKLFESGTVTTEEELVEKVKSSLEESYTQQAKNQQESELLDLILEKHNPPLPDAFLKRWLRSRDESYTEEVIDERYERESNVLKKYLIFDQVLENENAKIEEEDIKKASLSLTYQLLKQYGIPNPDPSILQSFDERNRNNEDHMNRAQDIAKTQKVLDILSTKITSMETAMTVDEFEDYMKQYNQKQTQSL
jgi:trigger factor